MNINIDDWPGWITIFVLGLGVVFSFGYKKNEVDSIKECVEKHELILSPANSDMRVVKAADLARIEDKIDDLQKLIIDILRERK